MQLTSLFSLAALALPLASAHGSSSNASEPKPDKNGKYWLKNDNLKLGFVPFGAAVSDVRLNDQYGIERDIVAGFDNATYYTLDEQKPNFGNVPGRYANRIKNATFEIDGKEYNISANDNDGLNTLHGGENGWGLRNWTVVSHSDDSITFSILDEDGEQGFPGDVLSYVTYTLAGWDWDIKIIAMSLTKKTPIMLTSHTYWNLDGFANNETSSALNHTLHMPYSGGRVAVDNILIPTGDILANAKGSVNDFWSEPKQIGASWDDEELLGNCGFNCTGYGKSLWHLSTDRSSKNKPLTYSSHRQLLDRQPRATHPLRLAHLRPRRNPLIPMVRHQSRRLLRPRRLPNVQLRLPRRLHGAQDLPGYRRRRGLPAHDPPVRLHRS